MLAKDNTLLHRSQSPIIPKLTCTVIIYLPHFLIVPQSPCSHQLCHTQTSLSPHWLCICFYCTMTYTPCSTIHSKKTWSITHLTLLSSLYPFSLHVYLCSFSLFYSSSCHMRSHDFLALFSVAANSFYAYTTHLSYPLPEQHRHPIASQNLLSLISR